MAKWKISNASVKVGKERKWIEKTKTKKRTVLMACGAH